MAKPLNEEIPVYLCTSLTPELMSEDGEVITGAPAVYAYQQGIQLLNEANLQLLYFPDDSYCGRFVKFVVAAPVSIMQDQSMLEMTTGKAGRTAVAFTTPIGSNIAQIVQHGNKLYDAARELSASVDGKILFDVPQDKGYFEPTMRFEAKYERSLNFGELPRVLSELEHLARTYHKHEK